jgi:ABC-type sugar transport system ATPase subunit
MMSRLKSGAARSLASQVSKGNGQTELIEVLAGLQHASSGNITLAGKEISQLSARAIKELGIAHIPEDRHRRGPAARLQSGRQRNPGHTLPRSGSDSLRLAR